MHLHNLNISWKRFSIILKSNAKELYFLFSIYACRTCQTFNWFLKKINELFSHESQSFLLFTLNQLDGKSFMMQQTENM